jgi:hypothetical protein
LALSLRHDGFTVRGIAMELGKSFGAVQRFLVKLHVHPAIGRVVTQKFPINTGAATLMPIISDRSPAVGFHTQRFQGEGGGGYTYTLTQKLGEYLREAERRYGQRNMEWTILGIEFSGDAPPVWFPYNEKLISIILTDSAAMNTEQALFQIAHEVIHLLEPSHVSPTTVFEEGLATFFAHEMSARDQLGLISGVQPYLEAETALKKLFAVHEDAVRSIRRTERTFFNLSEEGILRACPNVSADLAKKLSQRFAR